MPKTTPAEDANFITGNVGLIAVDKIGNKVLFLDPTTYETVLTLSGHAPRVHELAISPDHRTAFVPIYGDGRHGDNPHPGHLIAVFDLPGRRHVGDFSTAPHLAPHGLRWGPEGQLYCVCENSGVVLEMEAATGEIRHCIPVGSNKAHRIEVLPDGSKLYCETEEDSFASVIDLRARKRLRKIPVEGGLAGIGMSPDGRTIVLVNAGKPLLHVVDTDTDAVIGTVNLDGHKEAAQIAPLQPGRQIPGGDEPRRAPGDHPPGRSREPTRAAARQGSDEHGLPPRRPDPVGCEPRRRDDRRRGSRGSRSAAHAAGWHGHRNPVVLLRPS